MTESTVMEDTPMRLEQRPRDDENGLTYEWTRRLILYSTKAISACMLNRTVFRASAEEKEVDSVVDVCESASIGGS